MINRRILVLFTLLSNFKRFQQLNGYVRFVGGSRSFPADDVTGYSWRARSPCLNLCAVSRRPASPWWIRTGRAGVKRQFLWMTRGKVVCHMLSACAREACPPGYTPHSYYQRTALLSATDSSHTQRSLNTRNATLHCSQRFSVSRRNVCPEAVCAVFFSLEFFFLFSHPWYSLCFLLYRQSFSFSRSLHGFSIVLFLRFVSSFSFLLLCVLVL